MSGQIATSISEPYENVPQPGRRIRSKKQTLPRSKTTRKTGHSQRQEPRGMFRVWAQMTRASVVFMVRDAYGVSGDGLIGKNVDAVGAGPLHLQHEGPHASRFGVKLCNKSFMVRFRISLLQFPDCLKEDGNQARGLEFATKKRVHGHNQTVRAKERLFPRGFAQKPGVELGAYAPTRRLFLIVFSAALRLQKDTSVSHHDRPLDFRARSIAGRSVS